MSRLHARTGGVSSLAEPLARLLQRIDPSHRLEAYRLWLFWDEVVGEGIARRARPRRMRDGVLFVTVESHAWMQELQFLKEEIRERINARLGAPLVSDLFFVSGRVHPPQARQEPQASTPVSVPDVPATGHADIDAAFARLVRAYARRRARAGGSGKRKRPRRAA